MIRNGVNVKNAREFVDQYAERCNNDRGCKTRAFKLFAKENGIADYKDVEKAYYAKDNKGTGKGRKSKKVKALTPQNLNKALELIEQAQKVPALEQRIKELEQALAAETKRANDEATARRYAEKETEEALLKIKGIREIVTGTPSIVLKCDSHGIIERVG
jgi:hypothetical protein